MERCEGGSTTAKEPSTADTPLTPRALVLSSFGWPSIVRLSHALRQAGFNVGVVLPKERQRALHGSITQFGFRRLSASAALTEYALELWSPDLLVPCDEPALKNLLTLSRRGARHPADGHRRSVASFIGGPDVLAIAGQKSKLVALAAAEGLAVPITREIGSARDLQIALRSCAYPAVLKLDWTWGGNGVKVCPDADEAMRAYHRFTRPPWLSFLSRADRSQSVEPDATITLQHFIPGLPANRAVACHDGEVLAGVSVEVVQSTGQTGTATVVRIIDHPQMAETAAHLVRRLRLSGLHGFDFILENGTNRAVLLEINARATPICHFAFSPDTDMCGALFAKLAGKPRRDVASAVPPNLIAMFPQELWRDPVSPYLISAYHDVPWDEPEFVMNNLVPPQRRWARAVHELKRRLLSSQSPASIPLPAISLTDERLHIHKIIDPST